MATVLSIGGSPALFCIVRCVTVCVGVCVCMWEGKCTCAGIVTFSSSVWRMYTCTGSHTCIECQSCAKKGERFLLTDSTATDNPRVLDVKCFMDYCVGGRPG